MCVKGIADTSSNVQMALARCTVGRTCEMRTCERAALSASPAASLQSELTVLLSDVLFSGAGHNMRRNIGVTVGLTKCSVVEAGMPEVLHPCAFSSTNHSQGLDSPQSYLRYCTSQQGLWLAR